MFQYRRINSAVCRFETHEIDPVAEMAFICFVTAILMALDQFIHSEQ